MGAGGPRCSATYCLVLAQEPISETRMGAMLIDFSQRIAFDTAAVDRSGASWAQVVEDLLDDVRIHRFREVPVET